MNAAHKHQRAERYFFSDSSWRIVTPRSTKERIIAVTAHVKSVRE